MRPRAGFVIAARHAEWALAAAGIAILLLVLGALAFHLPGSIWAGTLWRKDWVEGLLGVATAFYFAAVVLVLRVRLPARGIWWVAGVAFALRAALLVSPPFMSSDVYRYVWDGRVQAAGLNPYRYVPADPALAGLRDHAIYPRINRADYAHTIYPPAAQAIFAAVGQVSQTVWATKLAMLLLEAAGMWAMLRLLAIAGLPAARLLIYAWNPLAAWAVAGDGHIDGAAIGFLGLALLARVRRRDGLAGALLGGAILTKFLPLAVAPALWRRWGRRWGWRMPAACACVIAVLYACYISVGWGVFGFLASYTSEEDMSAGSGFWLLRLLGQFGPLPAVAAKLYLAACILGLAALAIWIALQRPSPEPGREAARVCGNTAMLAAGAVAVMSPHYPWYYVWLALPSVVKSWSSVVFLSAAPFLLYADPFHDLIIMPTLVFVPAIILTSWDVHRAVRAAPAPRSMHEGAPV